MGWFPFVASRPPMIRAPRIRMRTRCTNFYVYEEFVCVLLPLNLHRTWEKNSGNGSGKISSGYVVAYFSRFLCRFRGRTILNFRSVRNASWRGLRSYTFMFRNSHEDCVHLPKPPSHWEKNSGMVLVHGHSTMSSDFLQQQLRLCDCLFLQVSCAHFMSEESSVVDLW